MLVLQRQRMMDDDSSSEYCEQCDDVDDDENALKDGENHSDYYKRLYPERYGNDAVNTSDATIERVKHPVSKRMEPL